MNKLLSSVSMAALALCLTVSFSHAMDVEEEPSQKGGMKRLCPVDSRSSSDVVLPSEVYDNIIGHTLEMRPEALHSLLLVSQEWNAAARTCLKYLNLEHPRFLTDDGLKKFPNLTRLVLYDNNTITDVSLQTLTALTSLDLFDNQIITDEGVQHLIQLRTLILRGNSRIISAGLQNLINLTHLNLRQNHTTTDAGLQTLTNLTRLNLCDNSSITDAGLQTLTNLTRLNLEDNATITDTGVQTLTNLTHLKLCNNNTITDTGVQNLIKLTHLDLRGNNTITDTGVQTLTNLTHLKLCNNDTITDTGVQTLTNLTHLLLDNTIKVTWLGIKPLTNLKNWQALRLEYGRKFADQCRSDGATLYARGAATQRFDEQIDFFGQAARFYINLFEEFPDLRLGPDSDQYHLCLRTFNNSKEHFKIWILGQENLLQQSKLILQKSEEETLSLSKFNQQPSFNPRGLLQFLGNERL